MTLVKKTLKTDKGEIAYYHGPYLAHEPTVVFLHGLSANHTTWPKIMQRLYENGYNCLALDLRGHGASDKTKIKDYYKLSVFTKDLKDIILAEKINQPIIIGYSFGGLIALNYAAENSAEIKGLVSISANHVSPLKYKHIMFLNSLGRGFVNFLAFLFRWQNRKKYYVYDHTKAVGYWHSVWIGLNTMPVAINFWMLAELAGSDLSEKLKNIAAPTIIIRAKTDPFLTQKEASDMAKLIPDCKIVTPQHTSHFIASQAQDELTDIILNFIKTL